MNLSKDEKEMMNVIIQCDGMEVPSEFWSVAEQLVEKGLITLGPARGPDNRWRRALLVTE